MNLVIKRPNEEKKGWNENMDQSVLDDLDPKEVIGDVEVVLTNNEKATICLSDNELITILNEEHIGIDENMDKYEYTSLNEIYEQKEVLWFLEDETYILEKVHPVKMKLKPPRPGSKVANLTNIIESKLNQRNQLKPSCGVDPLVFATNDVDTVYTDCSLSIDDEELARRQLTQNQTSNIQAACLWANNRWPDYSANI